MSAVSLQSKGVSGGSESHTPGPWGWFGNARTNDLYLATVNQGRRYVMGFQRWGMRQAQPTFRRGSRIVPASQLLTFVVGDRDVVGVEAAKAHESVYRLDIREIDNPDARLICAAPDMLAALIAVREFVETEVDNRGAAGSEASDYQDEARQALDAIDAAITKATGTSS